MIHRKHWGVWGCHHHGKHKKHTHSHTHTGTQRPQSRTLTQLALPTDWSPTTSAGGEGPRRRCLAAAAVPRGSGAPRRRGPPRRPTAPGQPAAQPRRNRKSASPVPGSRGGERRGGRARSSSAANQAQADATRTQKKTQTTNHNHNHNHTHNHTHTHNHNHTHTANPATPPQPACSSTYTLQTQRATPPPNPHAAAHTHTPPPNPHAAAHTHLQCLPRDAHVRGDRVATVAGAALRGVRPGLVHNGAVHAAKHCAQVQLAVLELHLEPLAAVPLPQGSRAVPARGYAGPTCGRRRRPKHQGQPPHRTAPHRKPRGREAGRRGR
jgi:hypothetical protein